MAAKFKDPADFSKQIERGAAFMDVVKPGWEDKVDPRLLDLANGNRCVLGQTMTGFYDAGKYVLRDSLPWYKTLFRPTNTIAARHGFSLRFSQTGDSSKFYWSALTEQWLNYISARKEQNRLIADDAVLAEAEAAISKVKVST